MDLKTAIKFAQLVNAALLGQAQWAPLADNLLVKSKKFVANRTQFMGPLDQEALKGTTGWARP